MGMEGMEWDALFSHKAVSIQSWLKSIEKSLLLMIEIAMFGYPYYGWLNPHCCFGKSDTL